MHIEIQEDVICQVFSVAMVTWRIMAEDPLGALFSSISILE